MHKRWISLLQQICCTDYMHTCKYKQLKVIGFVLNRGSSLKLHSLLTPSRPVHPQHLQQTTQTHTHMNTLHISQPFFPQPHTFTWIHLHANTHILTEGCMCWSLVVCSHVFSVVDATRHTKASWGFFLKKRYRGWIFQPFTEIRALDRRQKLWDVFRVVRQNWHT